MNSEAYSSYPDEGEMLLQEDATATILGLEDDVEVKNKHESFKNFYQKKFMIIYIFIN